ncbi:UNVERIFIED_CONTAM: hypothetical protein K2H54_027760 [Gekko kuhli]
MAHRSPVQDKIQVHHHHQVKVPPWQTTNTGGSGPTYENTLNGSLWECVFPKGGGSLTQAMFFWVGERISSRPDPLQDGKTKSHQQRFKDGGGKCCQVTADLW